MNEPHEEVVSSSFLKVCKHKGNSYRKVRPGTEVQHFLGWGVLDGDHLMYRVRLKQEGIRK